MTEVSKAHEARVLCGPTDHLPPDVRAMQQAAYSRSTKSILERVAETPEDMQKARDKLRAIYVGWAHKSVGQLGESCLWFEGVSQIAAKAIEDTQLFNGQECSTRYIDFTHQPMYEFPDNQVPSWQERWRALYMKALPLTIDKIKAEYPLVTKPVTPSGTSPTGDEQISANQQVFKVWNNTVRARAFDICRCLLPNGVTTNVSFAGTFDNMNDQFGALLHHPSSELRHLAREAIHALAAKYPDATPGVEKLFERNRYITPDFFYQPTSAFWDDFGLGHFTQPLPALRLVGGKITPELLKAINARKKYERLPRHLSTSARLRMVGELDFGSFRDLHRHRPGTCMMPLVTPMLGFHEWYLAELPAAIAAEAQALLREQTEATRFTTYDPVELQYTLPMGLKVPVSYECDINQFIYITERRTDKTVHQTLRLFMHEQFGFFETLCGEIGGHVLGVHADRDIDNFSLKRGTQTVQEDVK